MSTNSQVEDIRAVSVSQSSLLAYHPDFDKDVFMVAFSVEGQGFKTDSSRLTMHSEFFRNLLFKSQSGNIGCPAEGTAANPIVVDVCTKETFANFLAWLNHSSWEECGISGMQGYVDVLHMCHMWQIRPGFQFAIKSLENLFLRPAYKLYLARRYGIPEWIPVIVRVLLNSSFDDYIPDDHTNLGYETFIRIATGKEAIQHLRRQLAFTTPYPNNLDNAPHCDSHDGCKRVWFECWSREMIRRIHHPVSYFPLSRCIETLRTMEHKGMHIACKTFLVDWMEMSCPGLEKEEKVIRQVIKDVHEMVYIHKF